jgi:hypothetical protein
VDIILYMLDTQRRLEIQKKVAMLSFDLWGVIKNDCEKEDISSEIVIVVLSEMITAISYKSLKV